MPTLAFSNTQTTTSAATLTSTSFTPSANDIIVVKAIREDSANGAPGTPTGGGWTYTQQVVDTTASHTAVVIYTAKATTGGTAQTVACTIPSSAGFAHWSMTVELWTSAQLAATPATTHATGSGAPSTPLTTVAANSVVSWCNGDWSAVSPAGHTYNTTSATPTEDGLDNQSGTGNYVGYYAYQTAATAGSQTLGLTAPTGQTWTLAGIEIQDSGAAAQAPRQQLIPPGRQSPMAFSFGAFPSSGPAPPSGLNVNAGLATATGAALGPNVEIDVNPGIATGTGSAPSPAASVGGNAALATGSGTALGPSNAHGSNATLASGTGAALTGAAAISGTSGIATGTGSAQSPAPQLNPNAGLATGTGAALSPSLAAQVNAGLATGAGVALGPNVAIQVNAGLANGVAAALSPTVSFATVASAGLATASATALGPSVEIDVNAGIASGTGAALTAAAAVSGSSGLATGTGSAQSPSPQVNPNAGVATGTGSALSPHGSAGVNPGIATGTGSALSPSASAGANAGLATGAGTAVGPHVEIDVNAAIATGTGAALQPSVQTSGSVNANAGLATATGAALGPNVAISVSAGIGTGTGGAGNPGHGAGIGLASATAAALQPGQFAITFTAAVAQAIAASLQPAVQTATAVVKGHVITGVTGKAGAGKVTGKTHITYAYPATYGAVYGPEESKAVTGKPGKSTVTDPRDATTVVTGKTSAGNVT